MMRAEFLGAWYRDARRGACKIGGRSGRRLEVGRRRVALEETLGWGISLGVRGDRYGCGTGTYLFTFWPPGPEDREKVISHRLRGMVSGFRLASHLRAAERSSSV